jgi:hypothetical protein
MTDLARIARAKECRDKAASLRLLARKTRFPEIRGELLVLAAGFERLADYIEARSGLADAADRVSDNFGYEDCRRIERTAPAHRRQPAPGGEVRDPHRRGGDGHWRVGPAAGTDNRDLVSPDRSRDRRRKNP